MMQREHISRVTGYAVVLVTLALYLPALRNGFVTWDDHLYVYENPQITGVSVDLVRWAFTSFHAHNWHPLTWLSHGLDAFLWHLNASGHHATSILLHAVNTALVMALVALLAQIAQAPLLKDGGVPGKTEYPVMLVAAAGLLFGLHPVHVEPVAWISQRKELLSTFFYVLGMLAYIRYDHRAQTQGALSSEGEKRSAKAGLLAVFALFILALLSKPMAVTFPVILLLLDWYPLRRMRDRFDAIRLIVEKWPFFVLSVLSSVITIIAQHRAIHEAPVVPLYARLVAALSASVSYLGKLAWPVDLIPFYPHPYSVHPNLLSLHYLLPVLLFALIAACIILSRSPLLIASGIFYVATLLPVIGIIQVGGQGMADRYLYLPSIGPIVVLAAAIHWSWMTVSQGAGGHGKRRALFILVLAGCCVLLSVLTVRQIGHWRDGISLWSHELSIVSKSDARSPEAVALAFANRGKASLDRNDPGRALQDFTEAIAAQPSWYVAYEGRGRIYLQIGGYAMAIEDLTRAIALRPDRAASYILRAQALTALGQYSDAVGDYTKALEQEPGRPEIYYNRGNSNARRGAYDKAAEDYSRAIMLSPHPHPDYYANRSRAFVKLGRMDEAEADRRRAGIRE